EDRLVLWSPDGEIEDLGNLPGMSGGVAAAINDDGTVVGTSGDDAFVWTRADGMRRLADYGFNATASKATSDGGVRGSAEIGAFEETPVVWDPEGRVYDVHGMVDPMVIFPVQGMGLNDLHQLLVYGYMADGSGLQLLQLPALPRTSTTRRRRATGRSSPTPRGPRGVDATATSPSRRRRRRRRGGASGDGRRGASRSTSRRRGR